MKPNTPYKFFFSFLGVIAIIAGLTACAEEVTPTPLFGMAPSANDHGSAATSSDGTYTTSAVKLEMVKCPFDSYARPPECGYLTVPENHDKPEGQSIRLAMAIYKTTSQNPKPDPVVLIIDWLHIDRSPFILELFKTLRADRDLIILDPRGTGLSEPNLGCPSLNVAYQAAWANEPIPPGDLTKIHQDCSTSMQSAANLESFDLSSAAKDFQSLRLALQIPRWNIYSSHNGTSLALEIARLDAEGIRSLILLDPIPPQANWLEQPAAAEKALDDLFSGCAADEGCSSAFPGIESVFYDLVGQFNQKPIIVKAKDRQTGKFYEVFVNGNRFIDLVLWIADSEDEQISRIPMMIYQISNGKDKVLADLLGYQVSQDWTNEGFTMLQYCFQYPIPNEAEITQTLGQLKNEDLKTYFEKRAGDLIAICKVWNPASAPSTSSDLTLGAIPTLMIAGEKGWQIPQSWAEQFTQRNTGAELASIPGGNTWSVYSRLWLDCTQQVASDFVLDPTRKPDTLCLSEKKKITWITLK